MEGERTERRDSSGQKEDETERSLYLQTVREVTARKSEAGKKGRGFRDEACQKTCCEWAKGGGVEKDRERSARRRTVVRENMEKSIERT